LLLHCLLSRSLLDAGNHQLDDLTKLLVMTQASAALITAKSILSIATVLLLVTGCN
jgi:hypothetical protein